MIAVVDSALMSCYHGVLAAAATTLQRNDAASLLLLVCCMDKQCITNASSVQCVVHALCVYA
jgi:hypothetical protein